MKNSIKIISSDFMILKEKNTKQLLFLPYLRLWVDNKRSLLEVIVQLLWFISFRNGTEKSWRARKEAANWQSWHQSSCGNRWYVYNCFKWLLQWILINGCYLINAGVPNVGKSTFFNVLTKSAAPAENFPFCTIDPNESRVPVPDSRFDYLVEHHKPAR